MNVKQQIEVLKNCIFELEQCDPKSKVIGHCAYPDNGYSGDLDGEIYRINVEQDDDYPDGTPSEDNSVVLGIYYK